MTEPNDPVRIVSNGGMPVRIVNDTLEIDLIQTPARWEDLRFPAQGINPTGSAAPPSVENDPDKYPGSLIFAGNADNYISGMAQLPHGWKEGSDIHPHIHWGKLAADASDLAVGWEFRYRIANIGESWSTWSVWYPHTLIRGSNTEENNHYMSDFENILGSLYTVSSMINWTIRRTGNTDAYNGSCYLFEFDIHYEVDAFGSTLEYIK